MSIFGRIFGVADPSVGQRKQIYMDLDESFCEQMQRLLYKDLQSIPTTPKAKAALANQALELAAQLVAAKHGISRERLVEIYNEGKKRRWPAR